MRIVWIGRAEKGFWDYRVTGLHGAEFLEIIWFICTIGLCP